MFFRYLITHVSQTSAWIGLLIIVGIFFFSTNFVLALGAVLLIVKDETLHSILDKGSPWMQKQIARLGGYERPLDAPPSDPV